MQQEWNSTTRPRPSSSSPASAGSCSRTSSVMPHPPSFVRHILQSLCALLCVFVCHVPAAFEAPLGSRVRGVFLPQPKDGKDAKDSKESKNAPQKSNDPVPLKPDTSLKPEAAK